MIKKIYSSKEAQSFRQKKKQEYPNACSYSTLLKIMDDPRNVLKPYEEKPYLTYGRLTEHLLYNNGVWQDKFYMLGENTKVSETLMTILETFMSMNYVSLFEVPDFQILKVVTEKEYQPTWKPETKIKKIRSYEEVYELLLSSQGKDIITEEMLQKASLSSNHIKTLPLIDKAFYSDEYETEIQKPFIIEVNNVYISGFIDMISVNHNTKEVYIIDIKTTNKQYANDMIPSIKQYRYDIQLAIYSLYIKSILPEYKRNHYIIADSSTEPGQAIQIEIAEDAIENATQGQGTTLESLLDDYSYYVKNGFGERRRKTITLSKQDLM